jgi:hypothetical protein
LKKRQTFALSSDLLREIAEFRWRNRVPSLSRALELILRRAIVVTDQVTELKEPEYVQRERDLNNRAYQELKQTFKHENEGNFAIIALGKLQGYASTLDASYAILRERAPTAKHAIIDRVGEKVEAEATWEAIGERIS